MNKIIEQLLDNRQQKLLCEWEEKEQDKEWTSERRNYAHKYVEKPMMLSMLPNLYNKRVLMLGCGTGEESELLAKHSPKELIGVDISVDSIAIAQQKYKDIIFLVGDMHSLPFANGSFDFIYSSLSIHYTDRFEQVFNEIRRVLDCEGMFLFSVGHPIRFASKIVMIDNEACRVTGYYYQRGDTKILGEYMSVQKHRHIFPNHETLEFVTAPPSYYFKCLRKCGFSVIDFSESQCIDDCSQIDLSYYMKYKELPQFMAYLVKKCDRPHDVSK